MSSIGDKIDIAKEELDNMAEEEFSPKKELKERTYDAAKRRLDRDTVGRIAVLISFMGTIFFGMAVSYLNEQKVLTVEGAMLIIGGGMLYVGFRLFVLVYNYLFAKLQKVAIELDIKEAEVRRYEAETDAMEAEKKAVIEHDKLRFLKEQNRMDRKLAQDLQLRVPFFQEAQKSMMSFFARDDIVSALQVPPTFVESIERLDDILLKRTEMNVTVNKINQRLNEVMISYSDMCQQSKVSNELLDRMGQQNAEMMTKWRENDLGLKQLQNQVNSMNDSFKTLMEILQTEKPDTSEDKTDEVKISLIQPDLPSLSIVSELDEFVEKDPVTLGVALDDACDHGISLKEECAICHEEGKEEELEEDLPPPPPPIT